MATKAAAKEIIDEIRRDMTLDGTIDEKKAKLIRALENSLEMLSSQLYDKSTHFIAELIQNADDNVYDLRGNPQHQPTVNFTYRKRTIRIDSNETGFLEKHVRAICDIGQSTKTGIGASTRYIGEKGIGFKSVFKVADVVSIASRNFTFQFDKSKPLGLIAPTWIDEFPDAKRPKGFTSIFLQLAPDCDEGRIIQELKNLDPRILIFLRQLCEINITVTERSHRPWSRKLRRRDEVENGMRITTLFGDGNAWRYLVTKHLVNGLPEEKKRPQCSESEILLAFPLADFHKGPVKETQSVYAFLPVRRYGFPFLLQADFLLTTNRQDIIEDSAWNQHLLKASIDAFLAAVEILVSGPLKYYWPQYLPGDVEKKDFFELMRLQVISRLSNMALLESCNSDSRALSIPSSLFCVSSLDRPDFTDEHGEPFSLCSLTEARYVSQKYPAWTTSALFSLQVKRLTAKDFLNDLQLAISNDPITFQDRGNQWHSKLARCLAKLATDKSQETLISCMEIIPLRRCRSHPAKRIEWVAAKSRKVFFPQRKVHGVLPIPQSIKVDIVDQSAAEDDNRCKLFKLLGVKPCDAAEVSQMIVKMHSGDDPLSMNLSREEVVQHARYLYTSPWRRPENETTPFWFATTGGKDGPICRGSVTYLGSVIDRSTAKGRILSSFEPKHPFLHRSYLDAFPDDESNWTSFLTRSFGIQTLPRLAISSPSAPKEEFVISDHFRFVMDKCDSGDVLEFLRDNWRHYSKWIEDESPLDCSKLRESRLGVRSALGSMMVHSQAGLGRLSETLLPGIDSLIDEIPGVRVLRIKDPGDKRWVVLEHLGAAIRRDAKYLLACLEQIAGSTAVRKEQASHVYAQLQVEYANNQEDAIWSAFSRLPLIYTALGSTSAKPTPRWVGMKECISKGLNIASEYDQSAKLFKCLLASGSGEVGSAIQSLLLIDSTMNLGRIAELFIKVSDSLAAMNSKKAASAAEVLKNKAIFPIRETREEGGYQSLKALGCFSDWCIADLDHLADSFAGVVPLLAFTGDDLKAMDSLLGALHLQERKLSKLVKSDTAPSGKVNTHVERTKHLRARSHFFVALIPKAHKELKVLSRQIEQITVNTADRIIETYTFTTADGKAHTGREGEGEAVVSWITGGLLLFMTSADVSSWDVPPEVTKAIEKRCDIVDNEHKKLLAMLLGPTSLEKLYRRFRKRNIHVSRTGGIERVKLPKDGYSAGSGDIPMAKAFGPAADESFVDGLPKSSFQRCFSSASTHATNSSPPGNSRTEMPFMNFQYDGSHMQVPTETGPEHNDSSGFSESCPVVARASPAGIRYIGELRTSYLFSEVLGSLYQPEKHWTSVLRRRAGISPFSTDGRASASFTFAGREASVKIAEFLHEQSPSCKTTELWKKRACPPNFHFDIAVTPGDEQSAFEWTCAHIERMRKLRLQPEKPEAPKDVLVLVRICNAYAEPRLHLFIDPWRLYSSGRLALPGDWGLTGRIIDEPPPVVTSEAPANTPAAPHTTPYSSIHRSPATVNSTPPIVSSGVWHRGTPQMYAPDPQHLGYGRGRGYPPLYWPQFPQYPYAMPAYSSAPPSFHPNPYLNRQASPTREPSPIPTPERPAPGYNRGGYENHNSSQRKQEREEERNSPFLELTIKAELLAATSRGDEPYQYRTLNKDEIRLVSLWPGFKDSPLRASVYHTSLENSGQYRALSYVWGSSDKPHTMWTPDGHLPLTSSLEAALRRIRHPTEPSTLWVDAVCINQNEEDDAAKTEKAAQIRLLPHIFQRSTCVFAYIGSDESNSNKETDTDVAIETLMQIQAQGMCREQDMKWPEQLPEIPPTWRGKPIPADNDAAWSAIKCFFHNPWFRRAWIVQEIVFAPSVRVLSGSWMVDWNDLFSAVEIIQGMSDSPSGLHLEARQAWSNFTALATQRELEARKQRPDLLQVLEHFRHVQSKYARDHFFALLGLCKNTENKMLDPDYNSDFAVVVRRYACFIANQDRISGDGRGRNMMQMLYRAGLSSQPARFPSWIPNWTAPALCSSLYSLSHRGARWAASAEPRPKFRCDVSSDELEIQGRLVDRITAVSRACCIRRQLGPYLAEVASFVHGDPNLAWKLPIAGGATLPRSQSAGSPPGIDTRASYEALRAFLAAGGAADAPPTQRGASTTSPQDRVLGQHWARAQNYLAALRETFIGWRCVATQTGLCGVAPGGVLVGDVVTVLDGGAVPFILRKGSRRGDSFRLVGECYVHGLMDGEAARMASLNGSEEEEKCAMLRLY